MNAYSLNYPARRQRLMAAMVENSVALVPAAAQKVRSRDTHFRFRQDSDFWYLSGFDEPDALIVLVPGRKYGEAILFCAEPDSKIALWEGEQIGPERAVSDYGFDDAFPLEDMDDILPGLMEGREHVYYSVGLRPDFDQKVLGILAHLRQHAPSLSLAPGDLIDLHRLLHEHRLIKEAGELDVMRNAADITVAGHKAAMLAAAPGVYEYQLEAELQYVFARHGAREQAYAPIVGSGPNACTLHYDKNSRCMRDGELVLIDAGCEYQMYAADVTRTFPVNGCFSPEQKAVYDIVLRAQQASIAQLQVGLPWQASHDASARVITDGLLELGILQGRLDDLIEVKAYQPFYMHRVGHWLGIDVHDVGDYQRDGRWRDLQAGMVTTVEPGIYIAPDNAAVHERWRGIGIRIEDDVFISERGPEVLTEQAPKTTQEIESWMNQ
ncbi:MAG: aminopeptidase P N-terminal domain-containing protein [Halieaceae bacterium]|nr:aminopeptidase P N-terminal domain-containing protein [Halieaceae bacterium]